jgi:hypothetical protein
MVPAAENDVRATTLTFRRVANVLAVSGNVDGIPSCARLSGSGRVAAFSSEVGEPDDHQIEPPA